MISHLLLKLFKCALFRKKNHEYAKQDNFKRWMLSHFSCFFATLWTVACQAPLSMGFSRQKYWSGLLCPSPGYLPDPGTESRTQFWKYHDIEDAWNVGVCLCHQCFVKLWLISLVEISIQKVNKECWEHLWNAIDFCNCKEIHLPEHELCYVCVSSNNHLLIK